MMKKLIITVLIIMVGTVEAAGGALADLRIFHSSTDAKNWPATVKFFKEEKKLVDGNGTIAVDDLFEMPCRRPNWADVCKDVDGLHRQLQERYPTLRGERVALDEVRRLGQLDPGIVIRVPAEFVKTAFVDTTAGATPAAAGNGNATSGGNGLVAQKVTASDLAMAELNRLIATVAALRTSADLSAAKMAEEVKAAKAAADRGVKAADRSAGAATRSADESTSARAAALLSSADTRVTKALAAAAQASAVGADTRSVQAVGKANEALEAVQGFVTRFGWQEKWNPWFYGIAVFALLIGLIGFIASLLNQRQVTRQAKAVKAEFEAGKEEIFVALGGVEDRLDKKINQKINEVNNFMTQLEKRTDENTDAIRVLEEQVRARNGTVDLPLDLTEQVASLGLEECYRARVLVVVKGEQLPFVVAITEHGTNEKNERMFRVDGLVNPVQTNPVKLSELRPTLLRSGGKDDGTGMRYGNPDFSGDTMSPEDDGPSLLESAALVSVPVLGRVPAPEAVAAPSGEVVDTAVSTTSGDVVDMTSVALSGDIAQPAVVAKVASVTPSHAAAAGGDVPDPDQAENVAQMVATSLPTGFGRYASVIQARAKENPAAQGHAATVYRSGEGRHTLPTR